MQSFADSINMPRGVDKIKCRKELRFRDTKFVYHNHNRVVRECHMLRRRDRERSSIPVEKLRRLPQKSRNLRAFCVGKDS